MNMTRDRLERLAGLATLAPALHKLGAGQFGPMDK